MKTKKVIFYVLMGLPLIATVIALPFLPSLIPAHYDFEDQVTRWGSKYETLILPVVTILLGYFLLAMAKMAAKQEESGRNNENVCVITGIVTLGVFNVISGCILYTAFHRTENLSSVPVNIYQLLFSILGIFMVIVGNVMPKLRMNSVIGLRTRWSTKNETVWKKSQHFGGISYIVGGIAVIIICFIKTGISCLWWIVGILAALLVADVFYTYKVSETD